MENINVSIDSINSYIDTLINQSFSILPTYEENGKSQILLQKIDNILHRMKGFFIMYNFDSDITIDILSFVNSLKVSNTHKEIRGSVLKICSLLSRLKAVEL